MINKDKINKVFVYNEKGENIITTSSVSFPKDFFKIKSQDMVMLKGSKFPIILKDEKIDVIFEYNNGNRVKYSTTIDLCTEYQVNFHVGDGIPLEERRRSYKVNVSFFGSVSFYVKEGQVVTFEEPLPVEFVNLNIGGAYIRCEFDFELADQIMLEFMDGKMEIMAEVLRVQRNGETMLVDGFGCRFMNINSVQEEKMARFILDCQIAERDRMRSMRNKNRN